MSEDNEKNYPHSDAEPVTQIRKKKRPLSEAAPEERAAFYARKAARAKKRRRKVLLLRALLAGGVLVITLLAAAGIRSEVSLSRGRSASARSASAESSAASNAAKNTSVKSRKSKKSEKSIAPARITMSFTGDVSLGKDEAFAYGTSMNAYYDRHGPDYFLKNVRSVFEKDDLTIINFEGTLTDATARANKRFAFKAPADYVRILSDSSVEAANNANNHSHDYGDQSFNDTIQTLEANGITHFGYDDVAIRDIRGVKVGLVGTYELKELGNTAPSMEANIQKAKDKGADIIVAVFHWGAERQSCPDNNQVTLARDAIDHGADLVIGHHPHVLQGIEYYKGKAIMYSLGNFCFGGNSNPSDKDTVIFQTIFDVDSSAKIRSTELSVIPCRISSTPNYNDYCPTILDGTNGDSTLDKLAARSREITAAYGSASVYKEGDTKVPQ